MPRVWFCFGGVWNEKEKDYDGGELRGFDIELRTTYETFLNEIYRISNISSVEYNLIIRCVVQLRSKAPAFVIRNDEDLHIFLTCEEVSTIPLYVSTLPKCSNNQEIHPHHSHIRQTEEIPSTSKTVPYKIEADITLSPTHLGLNSSFSSLPTEFPTHNLGDDVDHISQTQYYNDWSWRETLDGGDEVDATDVGNDTVDDTHPAEENLVTNVTCSNLSHPSSSFVVPGNFYSSEDVQVGDIFLSKKELKMRLSMLAIRNNFQFRVKKSNTKLYKVKCIVEECKWSLRAMKLKSSELFKISKYDSVHTCTNEILTTDHRQASSWVLGHLIKSKFEDISRIYRPKDIVKDIKQEYGVSLSYDKAWRAREEAIVLVRGSPEESYKKLPRFGEALQIENPGSAFAYELQEDKYFKHVFMALGASVRGFLSCIRPVLIVDGTHLRGKYSGKLLVATGVDGNNQIYPVAFGVSGGETDESWLWFFQQLRSIVGHVRDLVIVSDRHPSLKKSIAIAFPEVFHGICIHHLAENLLTTFKNKDVLSIFDKAARACRESKFNFYWGQLAAYPGPRKYLEEIGLERWARTYQCNKRYNQMTTNLAESINSVLKEARQLPITSFLDHIRGWLQDLYYKRRTEAAACNTRLSKYAMTLLRNAEEKASRHEVRRIDQHEFEVKDGGLGGRVNIHARTCTCREFDYYELPCSHAIAACRVQNIDLVSLCSRAYVADSVLAAYAEPICPLGDFSEWKQSTGFVDVETLPPKRVPRVGRPRKRRFPSAGEVKQVHKCSRCGQRGHNKTTCNAGFNTV